MKKRILALLLCICMASVVFVYTFAEGNRQGGDVNGDGKVSSADAALVLRYCVYLDYPESTRQKMFADADCDGAVKTEDAAAILRQIVGLAPLQVNETDEELLQNLLKQSYFDEDLTEWIARFIQGVKENGRRSVLYEGAKKNGAPYSQLDCSRFVRTAYRNAGFGDEVYPGGSSEKVRAAFEKKGKLVLVQDKEGSNSVYNVDTSGWKPGAVLIYLLCDKDGILLDEKGNYIVDPKTQHENANHVALYVGYINGEHIIMDSGTSTGVRLRRLWSSGKWKLTYYVDPLG
jgi:hypothetical protein